MADDPKQRLSFAIEAVNEAKRALDDVSGDLESVERATRDTDAAVQDLGRATGFDQMAEDVAAARAELARLGTEIDSAGIADLDDLFGNVSQTLTGVADIADVAAEKLGLPAGAMGEWSRAAADVAGGLEGVIAGGRALIQQVGPMVAQLGPVIAATWAHVAALTAQAAAFIVANAPVLALVGAFALVAAGVYLLVTRWDEITEKVPILGEAVEEVRAVVEPAFDAIVAAATEVHDFIRDNWSLIKGLLLLPFAPLLIVSSDLFGIRSRTIGAAQEVLDFLRDVWGGATDGIESYVVAPFTGMLEDAANLFGLKGAMTGAASDIAGEVSGYFSGIVGTVQGIINGLIDAYNDTIGKVPGVPDIPRLGGGGGGAPPAANYHDSWHGQLNPNGTVTPPANGGGALFVPSGVTLSAPITAGLGGGAGGGTVVNNYTIQGGVWSVDELALELQRRGFVAN